MKVRWILLDLVITIAAFFGIWIMTHSVGAVAIAVGLALWNYVGGRVRLTW